MKKLLLLFLVMALMMSVMVSTSFAADEYFTGEGTAESPFLIDTSADLVKLAELTGTADSGYASKFYKLSADVDFANGEFSTPIGVGTAFTGTFDGDGHVIKNIIIVRGTENHGGLFSQAVGATFKKLGIVNVTVSGNWTLAGSLVGYADGITVDNCFVRDVTTVGTSQIGALVGGTRGTPSVFSDSYVVNYIAGGNSNYRGAFIASRGTTTGSTITNCYTDAPATGGNTSGGFEGKWSGVTNAPAAVLTNSYYGATTETVSAEALGMKFVSDPDNRNGGLPILAWEIGFESAPMFDGRGTEAEPYLIKTSADLIKLAELTSTAEDEGYASKYYKLANDIDFANGEFSTPIGVGTAFTGTFDGDGHLIKNVAFVQKGSETYGGLFSQAVGATFKKLGMENVNVNSSWTDSGSLVGNANGITVDNCFVRNVTTHGTGRVGALVGRTEIAASTFKNSYVVNYTPAGHERYCGAFISHSGTTPGSSITNSYTDYVSGFGNTSKGFEGSWTHSSGKAAVLTNSVYSATTETVSAEKLGATNFANDYEGVNGGLPVLVWENKNAPEVEFSFDSVRGSVTVGGFAVANGQKIKADKVVIAVLQTKDIILTKSPLLTRMVMSRAILPQVVLHLTKTQLFQSPLQRKLQV